ncbi:MAG: hypothetical protein IJ571_00445 [Ruminococcus sp.]|nr:hypothetical protein [Ruminococcus sp.]
MKKYLNVEYLRTQADMPKANYRQYLVNVYNYYDDKIKQGNGQWCISSYSEIFSIITKDCHNPDCSYSAMKRYVKEMHDRGYIKDVFEDGEWHSYIVKELDF